MQQMLTWPFRQPHAACRLGSSARSGEPAGPSLIGSVGPAGAAFGGSSTLRRRASPYAGLRKYKVYSGIGKTGLDVLRRYSVETLPARLSLVAYAATWQRAGLGSRQVLGAPSCQV